MPMKHGNVELNSEEELVKYVKDISADDAVKVIKEYLFSVSKVRMSDEFHKFMERNPELIESLKIKLRASREKNGELNVVENQT